MSDDESDIIANRRHKLERLRAKGPVFPNDFRRTALAADLHADHSEQDKETLAGLNQRVSVAGRVMLRRVMGKASFITLQDVSGQIQCYLRREDIG
jgi:lysyl-tRNA synthetase class 2